MTTKYRSTILNCAKLGLVIVPQHLKEAVTDLLTAAGYCWYIASEGNLVTIYTKG